MFNNIQNKLTRLNQILDSEVDESLYYTILIHLFNRYSDETINTIEDITKNITEDITKLNISKILEYNNKYEYNILNHIIEIKIKEYKDKIEEKKAEEKAAEEKKGSRKRKKRIRS